MGHRPMTGERSWRRVGLAVAVCGLLAAPAALVPALAKAGSSSGPAGGAATSGSSGGKKLRHTGGASPAASDPLDRLVVHLARPVGKTQEDALAASVGGRHGGEVEPGVFDVDVAKGQGEGAARKLRADREVKAVEPDVHFHAAEVAGAGPPMVPSVEAVAVASDAAPAPVNEKCFTGCALTFDGGQTSRIYSQSDFVHIGVPQAWAVTHGDPNMLVAVVDTDIDTSQPDLAGKVVVGENFSGDNAPDPEGHGTAVAGLIAAVPNNGIGIAGLGWNTKVLSVRVLDSQGAGLASHIAAGIRYAADYAGVKVINLSLQQDQNDANKISTELADAVAYAESKGIVVVAAAGNQPVADPAYPAALPGVVSVAAVDSDDTIASFSRRGPWVSLAAPGVGVLTLATPCSDGNCWVTPDGTSFATPIVSATAALVMAANPNLTAKQVVARLLASADPVAGTKTNFSNGRIDVARAVTGTGVAPQAAPPATPAGPVATNAAAPPPDTSAGKGYWMVASDGGIFSFGASTFLGSTGAIALNRPIVGMARTPSGQGYWLVASDGGIFAFGDARFFGSTGTMTLNKPIVGMAATPSGNGYWLVASDGGLFAFGDAGFFGSTGAMTLNKPIVGMAPTPTGRGYWLVASDGGIFSFGDARFFGSTGGIQLNRPIVDIAPTPAGDGYWLVASDGGIFAYGAAPFYGSPAGAARSPIIGIAPTPSGDGYWVVGSNGAVYNFGGSHYYGGLDSAVLNKAIVGLAVR